MHFLNYLRNDRRYPEIRLSQWFYWFLQVPEAGVEPAHGITLNEIEVTSGTKAQDALAVIDAAIDDVTNLRGALGAFQANTLESTANNLRATLENTINAESVIRDTDFASEIAKFTKGQVLVQAGTAMLSNANQIPQSILSLLR